MEALCEGILIGNCTVHRNLTGHVVNLCDYVMLQDMSWQFNGSQIVSKLVRKLAVDFKPFNIREQIHVQVTKRVNRF